MVISELLGVPPGDRDRFLVWSSDISGLQATGAPDRDKAPRAARSIVEIEEYFRLLCADRRIRPRKDLISSMLAAQQGQDQLSDAELINMCVTFVNAGHETTK